MSLNHTAQGAQGKTRDDYKTELLVEDIKAKQRDNHLGLRILSNMGDHTMAGLSKGLGESIVEVAKKQIELSYDGSPTKAMELSRIDSSLKIINDSIELLTKETTVREDFLKKEISKLQNKPTSPENREKIKSMQKEIEELLESTHKSYQDLQQLRNTEVDNFRKVRENKTPTATQEPNKNKVEDESKKADASQASSDKKETETQATETSEEKGMLAKLGAILCPPVIMHGIDAVAPVCGAHALAKFLGTHIPVLADKEQAISRSFVVAGAATICVALYKIYQACTTEEKEEETEADELDFFKNYNAHK